MSNHFIRNLSFKNFKCFQELNIENIQRVNLIGGKNNIGKTSFMEAIKLVVSSNSSIDLSFNIYEMIKKRQSNLRRERYFELDFIYENSSKVELSIDNRDIEIKYIDEIYQEFENEEYEEFIEYQPSLELIVNGDKRVISIDRLLNRVSMIRRDRYDSIKSKINFISSSKIEERDIAILYGKLIDLNKEEFLNNSLEQFDKNFIALKQKTTDRDVILKVSLKDRELPVLLSSLGEGVNRYIAILCAIWASKDGYLFIDEIENGIHFSNYPKLWQLIFKVSKMANCQIFITTHSKECIEAFNQANQNSDGSYLEFYRNRKTNLIIAKLRDRDLLNYSLSHNGEFRGE